jgi:hypothetical protein
VGHSAQRGLKTTRFERNLSPAAAQTSPQEILGQAVETAAQTQTNEHAFIQPEQSAPFQTKNPELLAYWAMFCTGVEVGTVLRRLMTRQIPPLNPTPQPTATTRNQTESNQIKPFRSQ